MTLGQVLRDARIAARLSIEELSDSTSIRIGLLTQMEEDNFKHCGGDTYARGHLRNIANKIGIDPLVLLNLYNEEHSLEKRAIGDLLVENSAMKVPQEKKAISWKAPATVSLVVLFIFGLFQIVSSNQNPESPMVNQSTPSPTASPTKSLPGTPSAAPTSGTAISDGKVTLKLDAVRGNSFIDVIVDGQRVIKGSLFQGDVKNFEGTRAISVYLSNPAGLDVTVDGELLPPLGGQNEEVRRTFR